MKLKLTRFPLLITISVGAILTTIVGFICRDGVYSEYQYTYTQAPFLSLVFRGAMEDKYPWSKSVNEETMPAEDSTISVTDAEDISDTSMEAPLDDIADNNDNIIDVSGNDASGNDVSGNDISGNAPKFIIGEVDDDYFTDAVFIGDSRTVGLSEYCEELDTRATFYGKVSLTIYDLLTNEFIKTDDGKISVEQALSENQFGKVYMMVGLNEIGTGTTETFLQKYSEVVERIKELQPDAIICIQGIMHVTANKSDNDKYFNNDNINERNEALQTLADDIKVFYFDMNEAVDDENGNLRSELSFDDIHLKASSYELWHQYLRTHAVIFE
ncbi:MAG: lipase [Lachnospiraceae bacterium]|nr:lipase [Lachnospiraceae bacterium]